MKIFYKVLSAFFIGFIVGCSIINIVNSITIDKLMFENQAYKMKIFELEDKINKYNNFVENNSYIIVSDIEVFISNCNDKKIKTDVENYIKEKLKDLYGKPIDKIQPFLIKNIFDGRIIILENKKILIKVDFIIISKKVEIYIHLEEKN